MSRLRRTPKVFGTSYQPTPAKAHALELGAFAPAWRPLIAVLLGIFLLFGISRLPLFQIRSVTVTGVTNEALKADLDHLAGHSIFSRQISRVTDHWLRSQSSLATLVCRRGVPNSLTCQATTRLPSFVWRNQGHEFLVDQTGQLFADKAADSPALTLIDDQAATVMKVGDTVASSQVIESLVELGRLLAERSIVVNRFFVRDALYQPGVVLSSFVGPGGGAVQKEITVLFVTTQPLVAQVKTLDGLLKQRGDKVANRVDLRSPGYVYYH